MSESASYKIGMICGFLFVFVVSMMLRKRYDKKHGSRSYYDERQEIARGKAYKAGFFTMIGYMLVISYLQMWITDIRFLTFSGVFLGIELSIAVFGIICIIKDAYLALTQRPKQLMLLLALVAVINMIAGIHICMEEPLIENHELTNSIVNLSCGILFLLLTIVFAGKQVYDRFHVEMED